MHDDANDSHQDMKNMNLSNGKIEIDISLSVLKRLRRVLLH